MLIERVGSLDLATGDKSFVSEWILLLSLMVINLRRRLISPLFLFLIYKDSNTILKF